MMESNDLGHLGSFGDGALAHWLALYGAVRRILLTTWPVHLFEQKKNCVRTAGLGFAPEPIPDTECRCGVRASGNPTLWISLRIRPMTSHLSPGGSVDCCANPVVTQPGGPRLDDDGESVVSDPFSKEPCLVCKGMDGWAPLWGQDLPISWSQTSGSLGGGLKTSRRKRCDASCCPPHSDRDLSGAAGGLEDRPSGLQGHPITCRCFDIVWLRVWQPSCSSASKTLRKPRSGSRSGPSCAATASVSDGR
ncbi:hypothetical protein B0J13DRAFT_90657 [Dactylonectria estremocensis]|uniref:Uncharacterized protein n=1 Tax=Dactylonectria estremocensis TaxID=1079267 RepID=A0A9P9EC97_9HYPO|nr:hypothetical protein B0J13DRAFT_90657 [Dactylonectria estremocensis]